jgi:uncharacterized protein (UPF0261 family)
MAERLNASAGPVAVLIPMRGWSEVAGPSGRLHDPVANQGLVDALRAGLRPSIEVRELDAEINDPIVADAAVELLSNREELLTHGHHGRGTNARDPRDDARRGALRAG